MFGLIPHIGRPRSNEASRIPPGGIRPNSLPSVSCVITFRSRIPRTITLQGGFLWPFLNCQNRKVTMNVKNKHRAVIEFFLLEGCTSQGMVMRLRNVYGSVAYCRASVFRWISEVRCGNGELRNEGRPGKPYRHEIDAIRSILQELPNASLRPDAKILSILPETVRMHMSRIGYTRKTLRWIPHSLICEPKQVCLKCVCSYIPNSAHNELQHLVTRQESRFYSEYVRDWICTARDENTFEVENGTAALENSAGRFMESPQVPWCSPISPFIQKMVKNWTNKLNQWFGSVNSQKAVASQKLEKPFPG
jgi:hypothetical protein